MRSVRDLELWRRLDDVIMGGSSSSKMMLLPEGSGGTAVWTGELVVEGGGFCGVRTDEADWGLGGFDGICLRVKAAGQRFKINLKTDQQTDKPENTFQACFDTADGDWTTVIIPWHEFRCVKRAAYDPDGPLLDPSRVRQIGLVYSRFEFNGLRNRFYEPGSFELVIDGGIQAYKDPRPQFVHLSSAGVERNAWIGDDEHARADAMPIIKLNPGGILNFKYEGELALRESRLEYTIVRPTGLEDQDEEQGALGVLEAKQGDTITGKITRHEVAQVATAALMLPSARGKTLEVRRCEVTPSSKAASMTRDEVLRLFLSLHSDWDRARFGLPPFPKPVPYNNFE